MRSRCPAINVIGVWNDKGGERGKLRHPKRGHTVAGLPTPQHPQPEEIPRVAHPCINSNQGEAQYVTERGKRKRKKEKKRDEKGCGEEWESTGGE